MQAAKSMKSAVGSSHYYFCALKVCLSCELRGREEYITIHYLLTIDYLFRVSKVTGMY